MIDSQFMNDQAFENQLKRVQELKRQTELLDLQAQKILDDLGVTHEQVDAFFHDPSNFSNEEQKFLLEQKNQFEFTFKHRTEKLRTIDGLKKKYQDLHLSRHWIPVR